MRERKDPLMYPYRDFPKKGCSMKKLKHCLFIHKRIIFVQGSVPDHHDNYHSIIFIAFVVANKRSSERVAVGILHHEPSHSLRKIIKIFKLL